MCGLFRKCSLLTLPSFFIPKGGTTMEQKEALKMRTELTLDWFDEKLLPMLMKELKLGNTKVESKKRTLNCFLANLKLAYDTGIVFVRISKSITFYNTKSRYFPEFFSYRICIKIFDALLENNYIKEIKGFYDKENSMYNRQTRINATNKLMELIQQSQIRFLLNQESVILTVKDENKIKHLVEYKDNKTTNRLRIKLNAINSFYAKTNICLKLDKKAKKSLNFPYNSYNLFNNSKVISYNNIITNITTPNTSYTTTSNFSILENTESLINEVFTDSQVRLICDSNHTFILPIKSFIKTVFCRSSFKCGGRNYTYSALGVQSLKSELRKYLFINNEETEEYDYKSLHLTMCYHSEGLEFDGDAYDIGEDIKLRPIIKKLTLISINSKNDNDSIGAVQKMINFKELEKVEGLDLNYLLSKIKEKHKLVKSYFGSDAGVLLQKRDGRIMRNIITRAKKLKIPVLPIHDSVVCPKSKSLVIQEIMKEEYFKEMSFNIQVDKK